MGAGLGRHHTLVGGDSGLGLERAAWWDAAGLAERRMAKAFRVAKVGAGGVVARLIGKRAFQHEDFFAERMAMLGETCARVVANDAGGVAALGVFAGKGFAGDARHGAGFV
jgi:hypothetical protein